MVGDFRASLYDLFGYLLPGLVMTAGLGVIWWTVFGESRVVSIDFFATGIGSACCLLLAYLMGHVAHAVGNSVAVMSMKDDRFIEYLPCRKEMFTRRGVCKLLRLPASGR